MTRKIPMPHPGGILKDEFLEPLGMSVFALAKEIRVPRSRINDICLGKQGITANIALRLGKFFNVDPQWFMNMQVSKGSIWPRNWQRSSPGRPHNGG